MVELINNSHYSAGVYPGFNADGVAQHCLVIKATFAFDQAGTLTQTGSAPIIENDQWRAEPAQSSLLCANDIAPFKSGGEILLQGQITPPHPHYHVMDIGLKVKKDDALWQKNLRLFGARRWQRKGLHAAISYPQSLSSIELSYENAYGGVCPENENKQYALNPVGKGFVSRDRYAHKVFLPQIECVQQLIKRPLQRQAPACFAARPLQWSAAAKKISNSAWQSIATGRYPEALTLPANFYNSAPLEQQFATPFVGGEEIGLTGMVAGVPLSQMVPLCLPKLTPNVLLIVNHVQQSVAPVLDTVSVDISKQVVDLLWRTAIIENNAPTWLEVNNG